MSNIIIMLIVFLLFTIGMIVSDTKKRKRLALFSGGLWGGLLLQAFILESQKYEPPSFFHLSLLIIGLLLSVYLEYKNKFGLVSLICAMCAAVFLPSPIFIIILLISFAGEAVFAYVSDKSTKNSLTVFLLIVAGLAAARALVSISPESERIISSLCGGAVVYYASSKIAPNNTGSNLGSVIGGLSGFFMGFIFY